MYIKQKRNMKPTIITRQYKGIAKYNFEMISLSTVVLNSRDR